MLRCARMTALSILAGSLVLGATPARAEQGSLASRCPTYARHLQEVRVLLSSGDQSAALAHLQWARESLSECIRLEAELQSVPSMLAAPGQDASGPA